MLARLLSPTDFGLVAMALVFTAFCSHLMDLGLGPALVQRTELSEDHKSTAFWSSGVIGLGMCGLFLTAAPAVGLFYGSEGVVPIVRALGAGFVLGFPESVYRNLLERDFSFRLIGLRRLLGVALGGAVGIALALRGAGAWALVAEQLVRQVVGSTLYVASSRWRPRARFSKRALAEMWSYSRSIVGSRLVNFFSRNLDNLLIGRFLGATQLGFYSVAYQGVLLPLQQVAFPIARVGFPAFASIQDDLARCRRVYLSALRVSLLVSAPLPLLAFFLSPAGIPFFLGDPWKPAVLPFQILSLVALVQVSMSLSPPLFNALGRADLSLKWTIIALIANAVGIVGGLPWGITGVACGYLAAVVVTSPVQFAMAVRLLGLSARDLGRVLGPMATAIAGAAIAPALLLWATRLSVWSELVSVGAAVLVGYLVFTRLLAAESWLLLRRSTDSIR